jgi:hypothetical protein
VLDLSLKLSIHAHASVLLPKAEVNGGSCLRSAFAIPIDSTEPFTAASAEVVELRQSHPHLVRGRVALSFLTVTLISRSSNALQDRPERSGPVAILRASDRSR